MLTQELLLVLSTPDLHFPHVFCYQSCVLILDALSTSPSQATEDTTTNLTDLLEGLDTDLDVSSTG
eukprot:5041855-Ditylum_brightwellii.AAC.1